jgi:hypothetical protein
MKFIRCLIAFDTAPNFIKSLKYNFASLSFLIVYLMPHSSASEWLSIDLSQVGERFPNLLPPSDALFHAGVREVIDDFLFVRIQLPAVSILQSSTERSRMAFVP